MTDVSIVILTYNKHYELALVLAALSRQDYPMARAEIVIVDDGSDFGKTGVGGNNQETIDYFQGKLNIRYFPLAHTGNRAGNRIYGAQQAGGRCLLFLDSDMVPAPDAVRRHMETADADRPGVSIGYRWKLLDFEKRMVRPEAADLALEILAHYPAYSDERDLLWQRVDPSLVAECPWLQVYSHNLCLRRSLYEQVGGFNPEFGNNWGVEDIELGYRLHQSGAVIVCNRDIVFYHLYHYENMREKFRQLGGNLKLFFSLHPSWEIELFRYEYRIWAGEYLKLCSRVRRGEHLVRRISPAALESVSLPGTRIVIGITDEKITTDAATACVAATETTSSPGTRLPVVGTALEFADRSFDYALVSDHYRQFGFFDMVLGEAARLARQVYIVSEEGVTGMFPAAAAATPAVPRKKVIISVSSRNDEVSTDHIHLLNLAGFLHARGLTVALRNNLDEYTAPDLSKKFMHVGDRKKRTFLESLYTGAHDFDLAIPNISHERYLCDRSYGANYLWYDYQAENEELDFCDEYLSQYDYFLYRSEESFRKCGNPAAAAFLPCGVDGKELERYRPGKIAAAGVLNFVWFCDWYSSGCGLDTLVTAFLQAFGGRTDVSLALYLAEATPKRRFLSFNDTYNAYINLCNNSVTLDANARFSETLAVAAACPQISITFKNLDDEGVHSIMAAADCLVDTRPTRDTTPLVLDAFAMGKKVIRIGNGAYQWYRADDLCLNVKYRKETPLVFRANPENIWYGTSYQSKTRHQLLHIMDEDDLARVFREVDARRDRLIPDEAAAARFRRDHDWNNVVDRLLTILW